MILLMAQVKLSNNYHHTFIIHWFNSMRTNMWKNLCYPCFIGKFCANLVINRRPISLTSAICKIMGKKSFIKENYTLAKC